VAIHQCAEGTHDLVGASGKPADVNGFAGMIEDDVRAAPNGLHIDPEV
jgi:hypothetical protein